MGPPDAPPKGLLGPPLEAGSWPFSAFFGVKRQKNPQNTQIDHQKVGTLNLPPPGGVGGPRVDGGTPFPQPSQNPSRLGVLCVALPVGVPSTWNSPPVPDYYGTVVNTAARIESVCHGGQIGVSQAVYDAVQDDLSDVEWEDFGWQPLP